jgi:chemotaxis protein CheX
LDPLIKGDAQPVPGAIRSAILEPFIEAVSMTMREMAGAEVVVEAACLSKYCRTVGDVSAVLALAFASPGHVVLSFPAATATALTRRVLTDVTDAPDSVLVGDCVGEVTNVLAGQAKALLLGTRYHFTLSTPTVLTGIGREIDHADGAQCLMVTFGSDLGTFALALFLDLNETPTQGEPP